MTTNLNDVFSSAEGMGLGSSGNEIDAVQNYLTHYGYADLPTVGALTAGEFDNSLVEAIKQYQNFFSLSPTGILDEQTLKEMVKPRCGFPDFPNKANSMANYTTVSSWPSTPISYRIVNFSPQMTQQEIRNAVNNAFNLWEGNCGVSFNAVTTGGDILISFGNLTHGSCPNPFDGPGGTLAHAYYPPPAGGVLAGDAHFDEDETWSVTLPIPVGQHDFETVAAHEFGHSIGLGHSRVRNALMFPTYLGTHRHLDQDDINGAQALYGV